MGEVNSQIIYVKSHKSLEKSFTIVIICYTSHTKLIILNFPVYFGGLVAGSNRFVLIHFLSCPVPVVNDSMPL